MQIQVGGASVTLKQLGQYVNHLRKGKVKEMQARSDAQARLGPEPSCDLAARAKDEGPQQAPAATPARSPVGLFPEACVGRTPAASVPGWSTSGTPAT